MLTATAGAAMAVGLLLIVAGEPFGEAVEQVYRWGDAAEAVLDVVRWPLGLAALVVAVTVLFRHAPRRRQPGLSWLAVGAAVTVLLWLAVSGLLALYVVRAGNFDDTYGPLTAVMALLLWANVTGIALLAGIALAAQLEAVRAGRLGPAAGRQRRRRHPRPARRAPRLAAPASAIRRASRRRRAARHR